MVTGMSLSDFPMAQLDVFNSDFGARHPSAAGLFPASSQGFPIPLALVSA